MPCRKWDLSGQGSKLCALHGQADSVPLSPQGSSDFFFSSGYEFTPGLVEESGFMMLPLGTSCWKPQIGELPPGAVFHQAGAAVHPQRLRRGMIKAQQGPQGTDPPALGCARGSPLIPHSWAFSPTHQESHEWALNSCHRPLLPSSPRPPTPFLFPSLSLPTSCPAGRY